MSRVTVLITSPRRLHAFTAFINNVPAFEAAIKQHGDWTSLEEIPKKSLRIRKAKRAKKGIFSQIYREASPKKSKDFAGLVATYRHIFWGRTTSTVNVRKYAKLVGHKLTNPSTAVAQAWTSQLIMQRSPAGKVPQYMPTELGIEQWRKIIRKGMQQE